MLSARYTSLVIGNIVTANGAIFKVLSKNGKSNCIDGVFFRFLGAVGQVNFNNVLLKRIFRENSKLIITREKMLINLFQSVISSE